MRRICIAFAGAALALLPKSSAAQSAAPPPAAAKPAAPAPATPAAPAPTAADTKSAPGAAAAPSTTAASPSAAPPAEGPPRDTPGTEKKPASGPPEYYVEDQKRLPEAPGSKNETEIYEPPPPPPPMTEAEAPPPLKPNYLAPKTAFWAGLRVSYFVPFATLWFDGSYDGQGGLSYRRRLFSAYASPGPAAQIDIGARLGRRYNVFATWEHASLGTGNLDPDSFGGQQRGNTNLYGAGFRFSTNPDGLGFLLEIGVGYRDFHAYWADGTELALTDSIFDGHIGLGADIRVNKWLSLEPMVVFGGGSFTTIEFNGGTNQGHGMTAYDQEAQYGTFSVQIGAHADVF